MIALSIKRMVRVRVDVTEQGKYGMNNYYYFNVVYLFMFVVYQCKQDNERKIVACPRVAKPFVNQTFYSTRGTFIEDQY